MKTPEPKPTITTLPLTVVYGQTDSQIEAGRYDRKDSRIVASNFPIIRTGRAQLEAKFVHFGICKTSDMVVEAFNKLGLRLGNIDNVDEILAVGVEYPDMQKAFPVVALGSVLPPEIKSPVQPDPYRSVIFLLKEKGLRELSLSNWSGAWIASCRFLGFPIKPSKK
jgi:hypothetical protein